MHESQLARQVLDAVLAAVAGRPGRVVRVRGRLAETEALAPDSLAFHFGTLARGTVAEGAELDLELVHVAATCQDCGASYLPDHHVTICPECGSTDGVLQGEVGLRVEAVDLRS